MEFDKISVSSDQEFSENQSQQLKNLTHEFQSNSPTSSLNLSAVRKQGAAEEELDHYKFLQDSNGLLNEAGSENFSPNAPEKDSRKFQDNPESNPNPNLNLNPNPTHQILKQQEKSIEDFMSKIDQKKKIERKDLEIDSGSDGDLAPKQNQHNPDLIHGGPTTATACTTILQAQTLALEETDQRALNAEERIKELRQKFQSFKTHSIEAKTTIAVDEPRVVDKEYKKADHEESSEDKKVEFEEPNVLARFRQSKADIEKDIMVDPNIILPLQMQQNLPKRPLIGQGFKNTASEGKILVTTTKSDREYQQEPITGASNEVRSLIKDFQTALNGSQQQPKVNNLLRNQAPLDHQSQHASAWEKGSFGKSASVAGLTSDGKMHLTDGLDYSSSALDLGSHTQNNTREAPLTSLQQQELQVTEREEQEFKVNEDNMPIQTWINSQDFQFQNSPQKFDKNQHKENHTALFAPKQQENYKNEGIPSEIFHPSLDQHNLTDFQEDKNSSLGGGSSNPDPVSDRQRDAFGADRDIHEVSTSFQPQQNQVQPNTLNQNHAFSCDQPEKPVTNQLIMSQNSSNGAQTGCLSQSQHSENYTKVSLKFSNKYGGGGTGSDSQKQATRKEETQKVQEPQILPSSIHQQIMDSQKREDDLRDSFVEQLENAQPADQTKMRDLSDLMGAEGQFNQSLHMFGQDSQFEGDLGQNERHNFADDSDIQNLADSLGITHYKNSHQNRNDPKECSKLASCDNTTAQNLILKEDMQSQKTPQQYQEMINRLTNQKTASQTNAERVQSGTHQLLNAANDLVTELKSKNLPLQIQAQTATSHEDVQPSSNVMADELKSLQSKILDLENKFSFTQTDEEVGQELLKNGIQLGNDPFKSVDDKRIRFESSTKISNQPNQNNNVQHRTNSAENRKLSGLKPRNGIASTTSQGYATKKFDQQKKPSVFESKRGSKPASISSNTHNQTNQPLKRQALSHTQIRQSTHVAQKSVAGKKQSDEQEKPKFRVEVDLTRLKERVHFAEDEEFGLTSGRGGPTEDPFESGADSARYNHHQQNNGRLAPQSGQNTGRTTASGKSNAISHFTSGKKSSASSQLQPIKGGLRQNHQVKRASSSHSNRLNGVAFDSRKGNLRTFNHNHQATAHSQQRSQSNSSTNQHQRRFNDNQYMGVGAGSQNNLNRVRSPHLKQSNQRHAYLKKRPITSSSQTRQNHQIKPYTANSQSGAVTTHANQNQVSSVSASQQQFYQQSSSQSQGVGNGMQSQRLISKQQAVSGLTQKKSAANQHQIIASTHSSSAFGNQNYPQTNQNQMNNNNNQLQAITSPNVNNKRNASISPHKTTAEMQENIYAASNAIYKEAASRVVELQRQVISLRSKLKQKEEKEIENEKMRREFTEMKSKYLESQKRNHQLLEANKDLQGSLNKAQNLAQKWKGEASELKKQMQQVMGNRKYAVGSRTAAEPFGFGSRARK